MHRDRVEHLLDGALAAHFALLDRRVRQTAGRPRRYARRGSGTRRSAWRRRLAARIDDDDERYRTGNTFRRPRRSGRARVGRDPLVRARGRRARGRRGGVPLPPAARVAAARGRDAAALRRPPPARRALPGRARGARRRAAPLPARLGGRAPRLRASKGCGRSRRSSPSRACRSSRCSPRGSPDACLRCSRRRSSPRAGRSSSTASTAGCTASSSSRARSRTSRCCARSSAADRRAWTLWALAILATVATHPYGALVLASQARLRPRGPPRPAAAGALGLRRGRRARDSVLADRSRARGPLRRRRRPAAAGSTWPSSAGRRPGTSRRRSRCCRPCSWRRLPALPSCPGRRVCWRPAPPRCRCSRSSSRAARARRRRGT